MKLIRTLLALSLTVALAACGGGDDSTPSNNSPSTTLGALEKYTGMYSYCDGDHTRYNLAVTDAGDGQLNAAPSEITYQNANCTGSILATYTEPSPSKITYLSTGVVTVNGDGLPSSLSVDKVTLSFPTMQASLTGPGVSGSCVNYPGGDYCMNLSITAQTFNGALYLSGSSLYTLELENGTYYHYDLPYIKN